MENRIHSVLSGLLRYLIVPIISIVIAAKFNILKCIKPIPDGVVLEACITIYLAIFESIYDKFILLISKKFSLEAECVFYSKTKQIKNTPNITFADDVCTINCQINLKGHTRRGIKNNIRIIFPTWVDVQIDNCGFITMRDNTAVISLSDIVNPKTTDVEESVNFKINMIKSIESVGRESTIKPVMKTGFLHKFSHNQFKISRNN